MCPSTLMLSDAGRLEKLVSRLRLDWLYGSRPSIQAATHILNGRIHTCRGLSVAEVQADPDDNAEALVPICGLTQDASNLLEMTLLVVSEAFPIPQYWRKHTRFVAWMTLKLPEGTQGQRNQSNLPDCTVSSTMLMRCECLLKICSLLLSDTLAKRMQLRHAP